MSDTDTLLMRVEMARIAADQQVYNTLSKEDKKDVIKISKHLSKVLRHDPASIGLVLDTEGWVDVSELIHAFNNHSNLELNSELLEFIVNVNEKQRYKLSAGKTRIRASQGHSIDVDLELVPKEPPTLLYHGTNETNAIKIEKEGLKSQKRNHVHLSADIDTAFKVGSRHGGKTWVITIEAHEAWSCGLKFYLSDNNVWLSDEIPPNYLLVYAKKP